MSGSPLSYVIFDLGGVLVELSGVATMRELAGAGSDDEVWERWLSCRWVRQFERGWCSADEFAAGVVDDWRLPTSPQEFLALFESWPVGLYDGAAQLVEAVRASVGVGCLSNTNALHWTTQGDDWGLRALFDVHFLSHELGLVKPDRQVFDHVAGSLGISPDRVLFLDDNSINVDGARSAGFVADRVRGVDEARTALTRHGVLAATAS